MIGQRSLDIYMLHNFLLPTLTFLTPLFLTHFNIVLEFWTLFVITILIISFAVIIGSILRNSKFIGRYLLVTK